jgi:hypothetical protein
MLVLPLPGTLRTRGSLRARSAGTLRGRHTPKFALRAPAPPVPVGPDEIRPLHHQADLLSMQV